MRNNEIKKSKIKDIVSHIVCKNIHICDIVDKTRDRRTSKFLVQIKDDDDQSYGSKEKCSVMLGISNLVRLNDLCVDFCNKNNYQFNSTIRIKKEYSDDICIDNFDLNESALPDINLLCGDSVGPVEALIINALAFTLYHEFGHVKYDDDRMLQIEKERMADNFALEVLYESCSQKQDIRLEDNPKFLGAFLDNILILLVSKPEDAEIAVSHPHPIERIYLFLEYFHIKEDSFLWEYAYDTIVEWANDNHIAMTFVKDYSILAKDKFLDFYHRYKK